MPAPTWCSSPYRTTRSAGLVRGSGRGRRDPAGPGRRAHLRRARPRRAGPGRRGRRASARAAPGDDLHRHGRSTSTGSAEGISFGVTAPDRPAAARHPAGGRPRAAASSGSPRTARPLYHAALAHGANHLVTLVNEAMDRLRDAGVVHPERVLGPLLRAALENTLRHGDAALTGPVARGDAGTIARHLAVLRPAAPGLGAGLSGPGPAHRRPGDRLRPAAPARRRAAARRAGPAARGARR